VQQKYLLALGMASCAALVGVEPTTALAFTNMELEQKVNELERQVKILSDLVKANNEATKKGQADAAASAAKADVSAAKADASAAEAAAASTAPAPSIPVPPNVALVNKKSQAAPNIVFEPLQPGMSLINNPNTWLGLYGTIEADIVSQTNSNAHGSRRTGFDAAPWMSANRFGVTGAHRISDDYGLDVIMRLEAEFQLPTGNQDTPGVLFNRDAWVGLEGDHWGKLTIGRQNSLGRDATQFWGDPYGTASPNLTEGGYINQTNTQAVKEYVGSPTGSRVDSGIVYKKTTGNWYTAAMYQFGSPQGQSSTELNPGNTGPNGVGSENSKFNQGSSQAVALAYNFGDWNLGGFYEHANVVGFAHQIAGVGGNFIVNPQLRLNAGLLYYTAAQSFGGRRNDYIVTLSGLYAPEEHVDFALAYYWINAHHAMQDGAGNTLAPYSDTSSVPNQDASGANHVSSGIRQTAYGSVRYKFDPFTLVFVGFTYTWLTDGFHYSEAHGHHSILDLGAGIRYLF
jgi:predicted porin